MPQGLYPTVSLHTRKSTSLRLIPIYNSCSELDFDRPSELGMAFEVERLLLRPNIFLMITFISFLHSIPQGLFLSPDHNSKVLKSVGRMIKTGDVASIRKSMPSLRFLRFRLRKSARTNYMPMCGLWEEQIDLTSEDDVLCDLEPNTRSIGASTCDRRQLGNENLNSSVVSSEAPILVPSNYDPKPERNVPSHATLSQAEAGMDDPEQDANELSELFRAIRSRLEEKRPVQLSEAIFLSKILALLITSERIDRHQCLTTLITSLAVVADWHEYHQRNCYTRMFHSLVLASARALCRSKDLYLAVAVEGDRFVKLAQRGIREYVRHAQVAFQVLSGALDFRIKVGAVEIVEMEALRACAQSVLKFSLEGRVSVYWISSCTTLLKQASHVFCCEFQTIHIDDVIECAIDVDSETFHTLLPKLACPLAETILQKLSVCSAVIKRAASDDIILRKSAIQISKTVCHSVGDDALAFSLMHDAMNSLSMCNQEYVAVTFLQIIEQCGMIFRARGFERKSNDRPAHWSHFEGVPWGFTNRTDGRTRRGFADAATEDTDDLLHNKNESFFHAVADFVADYALGQLPGKRRAAAIAAVGAWHTNSSFGPEFSKLLSYSLSRPGTAESQASVGLMRACITHDHVSHAVVDILCSAFSEARRATSEFNPQSASHQIQILALLMRVAGRALASSPFRRPYSSHPAFVSAGLVAEEHRACTKTLSFIAANEQYILDILSKFTSCSMFKSSGNLEDAISVVEHLILLRTDAQLPQVARPDAAGDAAAEPAAAAEPDTAEPPRPRLPSGTSRRGPPAAASAPNAPDAAPPPVAAAAPVGAPPDPLAALCRIAVRVCAAAGTSQAGRPCLSAAARLGRLPLCPAACVRRTAPPSLCAASSEPALPVRRHAALERADAGAGRPGADAGARAGARGTTPPPPPPPRCGAADGSGVQPPADYSGCGAADAPWTQAAGGGADACGVGPLPTTDACGADAGGVGGWMGDALLAALWDEMHAAGPGGDGSGGGAAGAGEALGDGGQWSGPLLDGRDGRGRCPDEYGRRVADEYGGRSSSRRVGAADGCGGLARVFRGLTCKDPRTRSRPWSLLLAHHASCPRWLLRRMRRAWLTRVEQLSSPSRKAEEYRGSIRLIVGEQGLESPSESKRRSSLRCLRYLTSWTI